MKGNGESKDAALVTEVHEMEGVANCVDEVLDTECNRVSVESNSSAAGVTFEACQDKVETMELSSFKTPDLRRSARKGRFLIIVFLSFLGKFIRFT